MLLLSGVFSYYESSVPEEKLVSRPSGLRLDLPRLQRVFRSGGEVAEYASCRPATCVSASCELAAGEPSGVTDTRSSSEKVESQLSVVTDCRAFSTSSGSTFERFFIFLRMFIIMGLLPETVSEGERSCLRSSALYLEPSPIACTASSRD